MRFGFVSFAEPRLAEGVSFSSIMRNDNHHRLRFADNLAGVSRKVTSDRRDTVTCHVSVFPRGFSFARALEKELTSDFYHRI